MPEELPEKRMHNVYDPNKDPEVIKRKEEELKRRRKEERRGANPSTRGNIRQPGGGTKAKRLSIPSYMNLSEGLRVHILEAAIKYMWDYDSVPVIDSKEDEEEWRTVEWSNYKRMLIDELEGRGYNEILQDLKNDYEGVTKLRDRILSYIRVARDGLIAGYQKRIKEYNRQRGESQERFTQLQRVRPEGYYVGETDAQGKRIVKGRGKGRPKGTFKNPEEREAARLKREEYQASISVEEETEAELELDFFRKSTIPIEEGGYGLDKPTLYEDYHEMLLAQVKERQERGESSDEVIADLPEWIQRKIMEKSLRNLLIAIETEESQEDLEDLFGGEIDELLELDEDDDDEVQI